MQDDGEFNDKYNRVMAVRNPDNPFFVADEFSGWQF
jgi:hypothetical protein